MPPKKKQKGVMVEQISSSGNNGRLFLVQKAIIAMTALTNPL
jgi:hypothetical protein